MTEDFPLLFKKTQVYTFDFFTTRGNFHYDMLFFKSAAMVRLWPITINDEIVLPVGVSSCAAGRLSSHYAGNNRRHFGNNYNVVPPTRYIFWFLPINI